MVRLSLVAVVVLSAAGVARAQPAAPFPELDRIAAKYKLEIVTAPTFPIATPFGKIDGKAADRADLDRYSRLFAAEFALYPPAYVAQSKLKRVVLCRDLSFAGQVRNAIPEFGSDTLYLDVVRGSESPTYLRKVIHHEFFHIVDFRDDGELYTDAAWAALSPAGFTYGSGGASAQDMASTSVLTDKFPGFLNYYSTTGVEEDKAEVFANLIVDGAYVEGRTRTDAVLKAKVARMKALLTSFSPDMDDAFWERVGAATREATPPPAPATAVQPTLPGYAIPCPRRPLFGRPLRRR